MPATRRNLTNRNQIRGHAALPQVIDVGPRHERSAAPTCDRSIDAPDDRVVVPTTELDGTALIRLIQPQQAIALGARVELVTPHRDILSRLRVNRDAHEERDPTGQNPQ
jgi:hypothetical protein